MSPKQRVIFIACFLLTLNKMAASPIEAPPQAHKELKQARLNSAVFYRKGAILSAAQEGRDLGGIKGCIKFALRMAHENAYSDKTLEHNLKLFENSKNVVPLISKTFEDLLSMLAIKEYAEKVYMKDFIIKYTKECQANIGLEFLWQNAKYFEQFGMENDPAED